MKWVRVLIISEKKKTIKKKTMITNFSNLFYSNRLNKKKINFHLKNFFVVFKNLNQKEK